LCFPLIICEKYWTDWVPKMIVHKNLTERLFTCKLQSITGLQVKAATYSLILTCEVPCTRATWKTEEAILKLGSFSREFHGTRLGHCLITRPKIFYFELISVQWISFDKKISLRYYFSFSLIGNVDMPVRKFFKFRLVSSFRFVFHFV
jgi:hypothetical protein